MTQSWQYVAIENNSSSASNKIGSDNDVVDWTGVGWIVSATVTVDIRDEVINMAEVDTMVEVVVKVEVDIPPA